MAMDKVSTRSVTSAGRGRRWLAGAGLALVLAGGTACGVHPNAGSLNAASPDAVGPSTADTLVRALGSAGPLSLAALSASQGTAAARPAPAPAALRLCVATALHLRASGRPVAARARFRACARRFPQLRRWLVLRHRFVVRQLIAALTRSLHGQVTIPTTQGVRTVAFERGTIQADSSTSVVVRAADGTTWTWELTGTTVVIQAGRRTSAAALAIGQHVLIAGPATTGTDQARLIVLFDGNGAA